MRSGSTQGPSPGGRRAGPRRQKLWGKHRSAGESRSDDAHIGRVQGAGEGIGGAARKALVAQALSAPPPRATASREWS